MSGTPAPRRRTSLAIASALALMGGMLALSVTDVSATTAIRLYNPRLTANTSCVAPGSVNRFTATITNSSSSNQPLGSALFRSNASSGFRNIAFRSFTKPVASGGQVWQALPDIVHGAGIYLRAASPSQSLPPGDSVTVTFQAKAPSSPGDRTWVTKAWQSTLFLSGSFSLDTGASDPVVTVDTGCATVTLPLNGGTVTAPAGTGLLVLSGSTLCDDLYDGSFPAFAGTVQITPDGDSDILVTFDDPNGAAHQGAPFCKEVFDGEDTHVTVLTFAGDNCDLRDGQPPCIVSQYLDAGHLVTTLLMNSDDPPVRH